MIKYNYTILAKIFTTTKINQSDSSIAFHIFLSTGLGSVPIDSVYDTLGLLYPKNLETLSFFHGTLLSLFKEKKKRQTVVCTLNHLPVKIAVTVYFGYVVVRLIQTAIFYQVINILLTKLSRDVTRGIFALNPFCMGVWGPYETVKTSLRQISSKHDTFPG